MDNHLLFNRFSGKRIHLGVCGSIAAFRAAELIHPLQSVGVNVSVTLTDSAERFITPLTFKSLGASPVYGKMFSGEEPFEHLEPGQFAHALLIAPATADILARIAHGLADDMLSAQILAFDGPVVIAPAMNPRMWQNAATQENAEILKDRGFVFVGPDDGIVACHDEGTGKLADLRMIFLSALKALTPQDMEGKTVMVTLGPTREVWDDVRFWTNASSGTMGAALAIAAWLRGAEVHAISGPINLWLPADPAFHRHNVISAGQMFESVQTYAQSFHIGIFTAAVADFRPEPHGPGKFKKNLAEEGFTLNFIPNTDILRAIAEDRQEHQCIVGFAAESTPDMESLSALVRYKLAHKGADMIVGNRISDGFGRSANKVLVVDKDGREESWLDMPKTQIAWKILDWVQTLRV